MSSNPYTFLAGLPAVLGFGAFIFYLFARSRGPANEISVQILNLIKDRAGKLPTVDERLTGKHVFSLLKKDKDLRKVFTPGELELVEGVRKSERRQQWFAFIFLTTTVVLSLLLYLVLVWKPWEKTVPHPINHFGVDFSFSREIPPDMQNIWKLLRTKAEAALATRDTKKQLEEGFFFVQADGTNAAGIGSYRVTLLPGFPAWNSVLQMTEQQPPDIGAIRLVMFNATFVFTDSRVPSDMSSFDPNSINKKWDFMVDSGLRTTSIPVSFELDFNRNRYRVSSTSYVPVITGKEKWVRTWEDLAGLTLVVMMLPVDGDGWSMDFARFHSELGLEYSIGNKAITTHDRLVGTDRAKSKIFTCVVPAFEKSGRY